MSKELNLNSPYKVFFNSDNNYYYFVTQTGIKYIAYFTDADEYFEDFDLKDYIYIFGFERQKSDNNEIIDDKNIKATLIAIIKCFFNNEQNVLIFVADISDSKHKARHRLFNLWKNEFDYNSNFEKYDVEILTEGETFYASMLISKNNSYKKVYREHFFDESIALNK